MFTGLVEELGKIKIIQQSAKSAEISIQAKVVLKDVKLGDSIAVNGICLTVTKFTANEFSVDVMAETLKRSNIGNLKRGDVVNLERALQVGDRLGGHLVSGHIDGTGIISNQKRLEIALITEISAAPEIMRYVVPKGSIAIDGISLTVVEHTEHSFTVSLIPHTAAMTTLGHKKPGDVVNLEGDMIGKYVERFVNLRPSSENSKADGVTFDFLAKHGF